MLNIFLYVLYFLLFNLSVLVIVSNNPIYSVCYLILLYLLSSILLFFLGFEFLAIIYIIVYIGAIMVLFLFIIMMLNIKLLELRNNLFTYIPIGFLFFIILIYLFYFILFMTNIEFNILIDNVLFINFDNLYVNWLNYINYKITNIHYIGLYLYNKYILIFLLSGFLLFISTIGSIFIAYVVISKYK